ncbi:hypothetical protein NBH20_04130 [Rhizobium sp. S153]|uniref:Uncharacterized protein n=1 Tax=Ciceribacter sichuanensis TaxID=2949647 RepID=A0ABT0V365_9HYPH|nr:hypothetical protein [Ciceribacter sp. S153]MCM2400329.1 hypothetical protein [Ciceribacter sp. S153]
MAASLNILTSSFMRMALAATLILGPVLALGVAHSQEFRMEKRGAGLVLFVSLQRQSLS